MQILKIKASAKVKNLKRVTKVKVVVWDVSFKKSYCTTG